MPRVPFADVGPLKIESDLPDEKVLFLSDILPTGYMGADLCDIKPGHVIAVWGAGPVGQFAIASAFLLGAERAIPSTGSRTASAWPPRTPGPRLLTMKRFPTCVRLSKRCFVITHRMDLEDAPKGYDMFKNKEDDCVKVVLKPS
jgi:threonine dehydrogenase-like Zn-dependent dehydrogenase